METHDSYGTSSAAQYLPAASVFVPVNATYTVAFEAMANGVWRFPVALRQRFEKTMFASFSTRQRTSPAVFVPESVASTAIESVPLAGSYVQPSPEVS